MPDFPYINARVRAMRSRLLEAGRMEELLGLPTLDAFLQALGTTPYSRELQEALSRTSDAVRAVDQALARNFSLTTSRILSFADGKARGHDEQVVQGLLQYQLDATNVKTAVKLQQVEALSREEKLKFFIPGGRLTEYAFLQLADRATAEQGLHAVRVLGFPVKVAFDDPATFERDIDVAMLRAQIDLYLQDPLGIDVVIAYLAMKYNEVVNLRLIARGKALGIPRDRVRKEMAVV